MSEFWDKVRDAHDIECPVCGKRPSFRITGQSSYETFYPCGHEELERLLEERENTFLVDQPSVRIKPFAGCGKPTLTIKKGKD